jgi:hypothetical protein
MSEEMWAQAVERDQEGENGRVFVQFGLHPRKNEDKSREEGRPIFEDVEYVKIMVPGDLSNIVHRPVQERDRRRFATQYRAFKSGEEQRVEGTPLKEWPAISRGQVEELAHFNVRTVEQLAGLADGLIKNIGPIQAIKQKAIDWIAQAKGGAPLDKMRSELAEKDAENALLRKQLEEQVAMTKAAAEVSRAPAVKAR